MLSTVETATAREPNSKGSRCGGEREISWAVQLREKTSSPRRLRTRLHHSSAGRASRRGWSKPRRWRSCGRPRRSSLAKPTLLPIAACGLAIPRGPVRRSVSIGREHRESVSDSRQDRSEHQRCAECWERCEGREEGRQQRGAHPTIRGRREEGKGRPRSRRRRAREQRGELLDRRAGRRG